MSSTSTTRWGKLPGGCALHTLGLAPASHDISSTLYGNSVWPDFVEGHMHI